MEIAYACIRGVWLLEGVLDAQRPYEVIEVRIASGPKSEDCYMPRVPMPSQITGYSETMATKASGGQN